ncbi:translation initiation factor IF-2 [uncultured Bacteroides sp.]|nr:translation initiation factor IF-2 [uncultured Bacteroides sp.]
MTIRLNKVTRDLNVGIATVVEFLQKKGYTVEANPNTKISEEQYAILVKEFSTDKNLRLESERFIQERQNKERNKASVSIEGFEKQPDKLKSDDVIKTVVPEESRPKFKPVGKIDLNNLSGRKTDKVEKEPEQKKEAVVEKPAVEREVKKEPEVKKEEVVAPVQHEPEVKQPETVKQPEPAKQLEPVQQREPVKQPESVVETKSETVLKPTVEQKPVEVEKVVEKVIKEEPKVEAVPVKAEERKVEKPVVAASVEVVPEKKEAPKEDEVFKIRQTELGAKINVIGQIDLAALNQSTRPKKKSKEEKRREREEKEKIRQDQKKLMKEAIIKEIRKDDPNKPQRPGTKDNDAAAKKKRNRINKEKVDVNNVATSNFAAPRPNVQGKGGNSGGGNGNNGGGNNQGNNNNRRNNSNNNRDRFKKPVIKQEVSEEDVAKQVKETLARLTTKGKNKTSKYRKEKREMVSNRMQELEDQEMADSKVLKLTEFVTANELATMMDVTVNQVIATCMSIGIMVSINQRLDAETINLVAEEFGFKTEYVSAEVAQAIVEEEDAPEDLQSRAPIVTVMGHVDHGKTSLLDYVRKANVIAGEAGGITQHIGAYNVQLEDGRRITFLDTPGHEAFTAMRARGAKVTDIAIIIVAADDNVMPQTKEAINHAMAAGVPIVFAINKVDKPTANPDKIKEELAAMNYLVEDWGGKYQSQDISAKKGMGVEELLEKVLLEAEMLDLKANPNRNATGSIIESSLDKGRGYVATVLVSNGTLKVGDIILAGTSYGRVKAMFNERNQRIKEAGPSEPALVLGLNGAPAAGDTFHVVESDQEAREITNKREQLAREQGLRTQKILTLDELGRRIALGNFQELNIIVKGDVDGSVEALSDSLIKLSTEQIQVNVIHKGVGAISESDVSLAAASDAIIVGFQVRPSGAAAKMAEQEGVDIRKYSVIYDAIEEVKSAMEGMLAPELKEQITATIEIREVFNITKVGLVAGAMVKTGKVKRSDKARLIRDGIVIFTGNINALKRFKDDVKEVGTNFECGISLVNCNDMKVGDMIETFEEIEVKQTL